MNIAEEYEYKNEEDGKEFNYFYRLIKSDYRGTPVYGIEIERKDYVGMRNINIERDKIDMISYQKNEAERLLIKLYKNNLSPIHLVDIMGYYADKFSYEADSKKLN